MLRSLRALGAFLALTALVVGIPAALLLTIGNPTAGLHDLFAGDVSDRALISVLAAVAWLAWAQFAVAVLLELASAVRGTPLPRRLPGLLPGQQDLARALVTALLLVPIGGGALMPTVSLANGPASAVSMTASPKQLPDAVPMALRTPVVSGVGIYAAQARPDATAVPYTVGDGPVTLWDIAETHLGAGERWHEIWQLSKDLPQPGGHTLTSPRRLRVGWTVMLPPDARSLLAISGPGREQSSRPPFVTVAPGDTLSELAAEHGLPDWHPIWDLNAGRPQSDGSALTNPDLIRPGWQLDLPGTADGLKLDRGPGATPDAADDRAEPVPTAAPRATEPAAASPSGPVPGASAPAPRSAFTSPTDPTPPPALNTPPATEPAATPTVPSASETPTVPAPAASPPSLAEPVLPALPAPAPAHTMTPAPGPEPVPTSSADQETSSPGAFSSGFTAFADGGVLLASLGLTALLRVRRRQFRERTLGRTIGTTPPELARTERALLTRGPVGAPDVTWLNTALRSLVQVLDQPGDRLPDLVAVQLAPDRLELFFALPVVRTPAPWSVSPDGLRWSVDRGVHLPYDVERGRDQLSPYPVLATIGSTDDGAFWLLDLEHVGVLHLMGDPKRCEDLARFLAAELAHNAWSDHLQVRTHGLGGDLDRLNPSRVRDVTCPAEAVQEARQHLAEVIVDHSAAPHDVLAGRLHDDSPGDGWPPHVLVAVSRDDREIGEARAPAAAPTGLCELITHLSRLPARTSLAIVVVDPALPAVDDGWQLHLDERGGLFLPRLDLRLTAQGLASNEASDLAALLETARWQPDEPMPPAQGDAPWQELSDATGAPLPELVVPELKRGCQATSTSGHSSLAADALLQPDETLSQRSEPDASLALELRDLAPTVDAAGRKAVAQADPTLDDDLAEWLDPDSQVAKLSLLGPVHLQAHGATSSRGHDRAAEVVAYLHCRPSGVTTQQFAAEFWPDEEAPLGRVRKYANDTRVWLGRDPRTQKDYLPRANEGDGGVGVYRIRSVLVDAELFRRLRLRGLAQGLPGGLGDLETALRLVTGPPMQRLRPGGGGWLTQTPVQHHYTAMIADTSHTVASHHLRGGNHAKAHDAASVSLNAAGQDDVALLDLVAAAQMAGDEATASAYVTRVLFNNEAEMPEDLPPRTFAFLHACGVL